MKRISLKTLSFLLGIILIAGVVAGCSNKDAQKNEEPISDVSADGIKKPVYDGEKVTLNILNWADYMEENIISDFEKEYPNINVSYETMTSNEEMLVQLENQNSIYDLCFPSDYTITKLEKKGLLQEIDQSKLPHLVNIDERFMGLNFDSENKYSVPYFWGTVGILYNKTKAEEPITSWDCLWDEKYSKQIFMYDSVRDTMGVAFKRLGFSLNTTDKAEIDQAEQSLIAQKPLVLAYGTDDLRDKMISGSGIFAVVYAGDAIYSIAENEELDYVVPDEGSNIWFDNVVLLKSSKNVEAAHIFIDYLCRSDIAKRNTEYIGYSTPNKTALSLLDEEFTSDTIYNPPQEIIDRCESFIDLDDTMKDYNDAWLRIKAVQ